MGEFGGKRRLTPNHLWTSLYNALLGFMNLKEGVGGKMDILREKRGNNVGQKYLWQTKNPLENFEFLVCSINVMTPQCVLRHILHS